MIPVDVNIQTSYNKSNSSLSPVMLLIVIGGAFTYLYSIYSQMKTFYW